MHVFGLGFRNRYSSAGVGCSYLSYIHGAWHRVPPIALLSRFPFLAVSFDTSIHTYLRQHPWVVSLGGEQEAAMVGPIRPLAHKDTDNVIWPACVRLHNFQRLALRHMASMPLSLTSTAIVHMLECSPKHIGPVYHCECKVIRCFLTVRQRLTMSVRRPMPLA